MLEQEKENRLFGSWVAGGNSTKGRVTQDFYPTPNETTQALIDAEGNLLPSQIWEPCCGNGAMSEVIIKSGRTVYSSDLVYRGYGDGDIDFLKQAKPRSLAAVTNPPFIIAEEIIRHAHRIGITYLALILKTQYWHAAKRSKLFNDHTPSRIYALTKRPDFLGNGNPTMDCIWCRGIVCYAGNRR